MRGDADMALVTVWPNQRVGGGGVLASFFGFRYQLRDCTQSDMIVVIKKDEYGFRGSSGERPGMVSKR